MKSFRHIIIPVLLAIIACTAILITGCKNKCGSTTCQNGGDCESNVCVCPIGYSGNSCQTSWSARAVGTYTCTNANCSQVVAGPTAWQSVITTDATNGGYTIDISNFDGENITVVATIDSSINGVSLMNISSSSGINATGSYDSARQTIYLRYADYIQGNSTTSCNMTLVKEQ